MAQLIPLLTAFGLGSIVSAIVQGWLSRRTQRDERSFKEKQAAYVGLLDVYHRAFIENDDKASKAFAYWQMRCELVAPARVRDAITRLTELTEFGPELEKADQEMRTAMRADLRITD